MTTRTDDRYRNRSTGRRLVVISDDGTKTYVIRPWIAATALATGLALSIAYLGATAYLLFRDDLIGTVFARNADLQQAYEDRIATLRQEIDRITSRQILDQVAFDEKIERVLANQRALDDRNRVVGDLIERARRSGVLAETPQPRPDDRADAGPLYTGSTAPSAYAADGSAAAAIDERFAALTEPAAAAMPKASRPVPAARTAERADRPLVGPDGRPDFTALSGSLSDIDREQTEAVQLIAATLEERADSVKSVVASLGIRLRLPQTAATSAGDAVGGPYVPIGSADALAMALADADAAFDTLDVLKSAVRKIPIASPIPNASVTSNFGSRSDPFLGSAAFHAGIDFRSPTGRDVRATGSGRVVFSGRNGGYGLMVEIDHGQGIVTRYAHLSRLHVKEGETVAEGDIVGEVGSTGRSTGPHLHYETRIDGTAVNPMRYLTAGKRIAALLR